MCTKAEKEAQEARDEAKAIRAAAERDASRVLAEIELLAARAREVRPFITFGRFGSCFCRRHRGEVGGTADAGRGAQVQAARDRGGSLAAKVREEVAGFDKLMLELRGEALPAGAAADIAAACAAGEERRRKSRAAVQRAQGEVRRCAQAGAGGDALAAAVQQRDEQRAAHVEALRAALATLMRDAARAVGHDVWDEESVGGKRKPLKKQKSIVKKTKFESRGASGAPAAAGDADAAAAAEAEAEAMAAAATEAAERVERALGAAAECAARYVAAHGGARQMGSSAAGDAGPAGAAGVGALCEAAVAGYDGWAGAVGGDAKSTKSKYRAAVLICYFL